MQNAKRLKNTLFLGGFSAATNQPPNILHGLTSEHFLVKACRYVDSFKWSAYVHCVAIGYIKMALCFSLALPEKIMGFLLAPLMLCFYQILALIGLTILIGKPTPFHVLCSGSHSHSLTLSLISLIFVGAYSTAIVYEIKLAADLYFSKRFFAFPQSRLSLDFLHPWRLLWTCPPFSVVVAATVSFLLLRIFSISQP